MPSWCGLVSMSMYENNTLDSNKPRLLGPRERSRDTADEFKGKLLTARQPKGARLGLRSQGEQNLAWVGVVTGPAQGPKPSMSGQCLMRGALSLLWDPKGPQRGWGFGNYVSDRSHALGTTRGFPSMHCVWEPAAGRVRGTLRGGLALPSWPPTRSSFRQDWRCLASHWREMQKKRSGG